MPPIAKEILIGLALFTVFVFVFPPVSGIAGIVHEITS